MSVSRPTRYTMILRLTALGLAVVFAGCRDSGLPGKNLPHAQARTTEWRYPAYEADPASEALYQLFGRRWHVSGMM